MSELLPPGAPPAPTMPLSALLLGMGKTVVEVVETLVKADCPGFRSSPFCCPVANYLRKELRRFGVTRVLVAGGLVHTHPTIENSNGLTLPRPVEKFAYEFDVGMWPVLEALEITL